MNIFKNIRTSYYELWDYIDESQGAFVNKKGEIVAIVDMCNPFTYSILKHFFKETNDIDLTKKDYFRLYPKRAKGLTFAIDIPEHEYDETYTFGYILLRGDMENFDKLADLLNEIWIPFLMKPVEGPWLAADDIDLEQKKLMEFEKLYKNIVRTPKVVKLLSENEIFKKHLSFRLNDLAFLYSTYKDYEYVASNEYSQKAFEAYLKFEATCKLLDVTPVQS